MMFHRDLTFVPIVRLTSEVAPWKTDGSKDETSTLRCSSEVQSVNTKFPMVTPAGISRLVIKSIDRLGRNCEMIIDEWRAITEKKGADILVLDMPLLDTRSKEGGLVSRFISDVVLQVLSFVAENERENIRARQAEGIRSARERGVRFGRPRREFSSEMRAVAEDYLAGRITLGAALDATGMKKDNFYYHLRRLKRPAR